MRTNEVEYWAIEIRVDDRLFQRYVYDEKAAEAYGSYWKWEREEIQPIVDMLSNVYKYEEKINGKVYEVNASTGNPRVEELHTTLRRRKK